MTMEELKSVWDNKDATILEKTIAGALKKSIEKGSLWSIETLLNRTFGKPIESIKQENTGETTITVVYAEKPNDNT